MASGIKISQLNPATTLDGTESLPVVQNGVTVKATTNQIKTLSQTSVPAANVVGTLSSATIPGSNVTGTLPINHGGTGQTTANAAFNALAPSQASNSGKYLTTDGSNTSWGSISTGLTVNSTPISGGTTGRLLYDNSSTLGEALATVISSTQLQLGTTDNATPTARTLSFEGATAGATNAGVYGYMKAPATTGAPSQSGLVLQVPVAGGSGTSANSFIDALQVTSRGPYGIPLNNGGFVVGNSLGGLTATGDANTMNMFISNRPVLVTSPFLAGSGGVSVPALGFFPASYAIDTVQYPAAILRYGGATNTVTWGDVDAASPSAQVQNVQNVSAGTSDTAGATWTIQGSRGTGTGVGGDIVFQTAPAGSSGSAQNALSTALTIKGDGSTQVSGSLAGTSIGLTSGSTIYNATAIPAGGTAGTGYKFSSTANFGVFFGSGAPTLSAAQGSLYVRSDGAPYYNNNGTTGWTQIGAGITAANDSSTASDLYPLFAASATGTIQNVYTDNGDLNFKPSTGELKARVPVANNGIFVNSQTVSTDYTIASGQSGMSAGPVTVASGKSVTVSSGSKWVVL